MESDSPSPLAVTGDKGGSARLADGDLDTIKAELRHLVARAGISVASRRRLAEEVRFCRWAGQSADGRKHRADLRREAFPFEGASDATVRLADMLVKENKRIALTALKNMALRGVDASGDGLAGHLSRLADWLIKNKLTATWADEWELFLEYALADSPAVAAMGMFWEQRMTLSEKSVSAESLTALTGADALFIQAVLFDPAREPDALALLATAFPGADAASMRRALAALRAGDSATLTVPEVAENRPYPMALRFMQDVFVPENTSRWDRPRYVFHREWLSEVELRERIHAQGYDPDAVEEVLDHEGATVLPVTADRNRLSAIRPGWTGLTDTDAYRGLFEVITVYYRAVNDAGVPALYTVVMHGALDKPVRERELVGFSHGKFPFSFFAYERLTGRAWESRGIPELVATDQYTIKLHVDAINDNAQIATLPPVKRPSNRPDLRVMLEPLGEIDENRPGEVSFMTPPQYPATAAKASEDALLRVSSYFGRPINGVSPQLVIGYSQALVDRFLPAVAESIHQMIALALQYMPADELERIVPGLGAYAGMDPRDLRGRYDFTVSFDARTLDIEWLKTLGDLFGKYVLQWDTLSTVERDKAVRWFAGKLDADTLQFIRSADSAAADELKDEDANFAFIAAGGEPPMLESGQNFAARFDRLNSNVMKNPEAVAAWPEKSRAVLAARLDHLKFMAEQHTVNAQTGRLGAKPVLE